MKIVGDIPHAAERVPSGDYLLDKGLGDSLGNRGLPLYTLWEIYGPKGVGKTTFATDIAGTIAKATGNRIDYGDIEGQYELTLTSILKNVGFNDTLNMIRMRPRETPETTLERFIDACFEDDAGIGVFDALGAYTAGSEFKGKLTDRNVGEKAMVLGRFTGRLLRAVETAEYGRAILMLNHEHPQFGTRVATTATSGGEKKKYITHVRIRLQQAFLGKSVIFFDKGYLLKGKIDDNRFGYKKGIFYPYIVMGQGVHRGLTAMWECIALGLADVSADTIGTGTKVSMDKQSFGKIGEINARANDDPSFFQPFMDKLKQNDTESIVADDDKESEEE